MPVRAIVFDFDGVLADSEGLHLRLYQELLEPAGVVLTEADYRKDYLGLDDEGVFRKLAADFNLLVADEEVEMLIVEKGRRFEQAVKGAAVLYPQAEACVRRLGARWPLGIASGALRRDIELILRPSGLLDAFAFIVAAEDVDENKPAPDAYLLAAGLHGVPAGSCVAIEDSLPGLQSAHAAGLKTIAVTHTFPREAVSHADAVVDALDEITTDLVDRLEAGG